MTSPNRAVPLLVGYCSTMFFMPGCAPKVAPTEPAAVVAPTEPVPVAPSFPVNVSVPDIRGYTIPVVTLGVQSMLLGSSEGTQKVCVYDPDWSDLEKRDRIGTFDVAFVHGEIVSKSELVGLTRDFAVATSTFGKTAVQTWKRCSLYDIDCEDVGFTISHSFPLGSSSARPVSAVSAECTASDPCFEVDPEAIAGLRAVSATVHQVFDPTELSELQVKAEGEVYIDTSIGPDGTTVSGGARIKF